MCWIKEYYIVTRKNLKQIFDKAYLISLVTGASAILTLFIYIYLFLFYFILFLPCSLLLTRPVVRNVCASSSEVHIYSLIFLVHLKACGDRVWPALCNS